MNTIIGITLFSTFILIYAGVCAHYMHFGASTKYKVISALQATGITIGAALVILILFASLSAL